MHPILFKVGPFTVYSYGVMVALGFSVAAWLIYKNSGAFNLDRNKTLDALILILIGGIIGARLMYVILNLSYYAENPIEIVNLPAGGLVWYGGFLGGLVSLIIYLNKVKINFWAFSDLVAPFLALGQSFGRIGCFLNGCCYGKELEGFGRYPVQLYAALLLLLIFVILRICQERRHFNGEIFLAYCALYSLKRFGIEFLRGDNPVIAFGLTISQIISIVVFFCAIIVFLRKDFNWKKSLH